MKRLRRPATGIAAIVAMGSLVLSTGCALKVQQRALVEPTAVALAEGLDGRPPWLKAHLPNGDLYLLAEWQLDEDRLAVQGRGTHLNARRDILATGSFTVSLDSVAIFESNVVQASPAAAGLTVLTVATAAMTFYCISNPKACFGSCPTFYADDETGQSMLMAEGFSASIAPALEDDDLDMLDRATAVGGAFRLALTNEALETHAVRRADLLVAPRPVGGRVFPAQNGTWYRATRLQPARRATDVTGDVSALLRRHDGSERSSLADSTDLAAKEVVVLEFDTIPDGDLGLVVTSRHALLSTYLFYQGLAYLGENAVPALARLAGGQNPEPQGVGVGRLLGRIEVQLPTADGGWSTVGTAGETGPLATNTHLVRLPRPDPADPRIRLRLTRGNWRIDRVALAVLGDRVAPRRVRPAAVLRNGTPDEDALTALTARDRLLVTLPGDRYELVYELPDSATVYDVALDSRGYYLEWMRTEWLAEEDPVLAAMLLLRPGLALTRLAPAYKRIEPDMEAHFWGSRYACP